MKISAILDLKLARLSTVEDNIVLVLLRSSCASVFESELVAGFREEAFGSGPLSCSAMILSKESSP